MSASVAFTLTVVNPANKRDRPSSAEDGAAGGGAAAAAAAAGAACVCAAAVGEARAAPAFLDGSPTILLSVMTLRFRT